jgi:lipopolysaccharide/colanic/teichoic acid biosynthesis glycosyltransferase
MRTPTNPTLNESSMPNLRDGINNWEVEQLSRANWYEPVKAVAEFLAALTILIATWPVILIAAVLVKLTSSGPAFYSQTRLGKYRRLFTIYKLRSMRHNCEMFSGVCWSAAGDKRITPLGRFLRKTHIDELPQLWNILRGEMSLIGPRPERPEFVPYLEKKVPLYRSRLLVRPGVTGLAQVQLPPDTDLASVRRKLTYDLYYVSNCSLWMDLRILFATGLHILAVPYQTIRSLFRFPSGEVIDDAYRTLIPVAQAVSAPESELQAEPEAPEADEIAAPCVVPVRN